MKSVLRIRIAALAACVITFAQIAVAAQPWPVDAVPHRHAPPTAVDAADMPQHCTGQFAHDDAGPASQGDAPSPNFCEVHCQDAAQPHAMVVALASPVPQAWLPVSLADGSVEHARSHDPLSAICASPPARLLFSRFLN
jgi:hypothetical protein